LRRRRRPAAVADIIRQRSSDRGRLLSTPGTNLSDKTLDATLRIHVPRRATKPFMMPKWRALDGGRCEYEAHLARWHLFRVEVVAGCRPRPILSCATGCLRLGPLQANSALLHSPTLAEAFACQLLCRMLLRLILANVICQRCPYYVVIRVWPPYSTIIRRGFVLGCAICHRRIPCCVNVTSCFERASGALHHVQHE
jgi:hypothetical protein